MTLKMEKAIGDKNFKSRVFLEVLKRIWSLKAEEGRLKKTVSLFDNRTGDRENPLSALVSIQPFLQEGIL